MLRVTSFLISSGTLRCLVGTGCLSLLAANAPAATLTWGIGGTGGSGNWDATTANWWNGTQNVPWTAGGNADFAGSGGTVTPGDFNVAASAITFDTPGYTLQSGEVEGGGNGLTIATNVDATINSLLEGTSYPTGDNLIKTGAGTLTMLGTNFFGNVHVEQGEYRIGGFSNLFFSDVTLDANTTVTLGQTSPSANMGSISGSGVVQPDTEARTVTLTLFAPSNFSGTLQDNGPGKLAVEILSASAPTMFMGANTYTGTTTIIDRSTLRLVAQGSILDSAITVGKGGTLALDNSLGTTDRLSDTATITLLGGSLSIAAVSSALNREIAGPLSIEGGVTVSPASQAGLTSGSITFASVQRVNRATLNISGGGSATITGLANDPTGIVSPYVTVGTDWATSDANGLLSAFTAYATDLNSGTAADHVKIASSGTISLLQSETRASLNLSNPGGATAILSLSAGQTLTLTSGGLLSSGPAGSAIEGGSLQAGSAEWVLTNSNDLAIDSSLGGTAGLTKGGTGTLTLGGQNGYSGTTTINAGTVVVRTDANLGQGTLVQIDGGTLQTGAGFTSSKGLAGGNVGGTIDTGTGNASFSGAVTGSFTKLGSGTLSLSNNALGTWDVNTGTLALHTPASGTVSLSNATLQLDGGVLTFLEIAGKSVMNPGPSGAAPLVTENLSVENNGVSGPVNQLQILFDLGAASQDHWTINSILGQMPAGGLVYTFRNLGGLTTGVNYEVMAFTNSIFPPISSSVFAIDPTLLSQGWAGTFTVHQTDVTVNFTAVPEPSCTFLFLSAGFLFCAFHRFRRQPANQPRT